MLALPRYIGVIMLCEIAQTYSNPITVDSARSCSYRCSGKYPVARTVQHAAPAATPCLSAKSNDCSFISAASIPASIASPAPTALITSTGGVLAYQHNCPSNPTAPGLPRL